jgi:hypothetical protein
MSDQILHLKKKVQEIEESEYREQTRTRLVPPHVVLINATNQKQYDELLRKYQRDRVLQNEFLASPDSGTQSDNLLESVNEQVFQKRWNRLALEYQINRLFIFLNEFAEKNFAMQNVPDFIRLRKSLVDAAFHRKLFEHQVIYDSQKGAIREIRGLTSLGEFTLIDPPPVKERIVSIERVVEERPDGTIIVAPIENISSGPKDSYEPERLVQTKIKAPKVKLRI